MEGPQGLISSPRPVYFPSTSGRGLSSGEGKATSSSVFPPRAEGRQPFMVDMKRPGLRSIHLPWGRRMQPPGAVPRGDLPILWLLSLIFL